MQLRGAFHLWHEQGVETVERQGLQIEVKFGRVDAVDPHDALAIAELERTQRRGNQGSRLGFARARHTIFEVECERVGGQ